MAGVLEGMEREFASAIAMALADGKGFITLGSLDTSLLGEAFGELNTSEIILTGERYNHIATRHPEDLHMFVNHAHLAILSPDEILVDSRRGASAIYLRQIGDYHLAVYVRLSQGAEEIARSNSIITSHVLRAYSLNQLRKRNPLVYTQNDL